ncbi:MAG: response regulator transcription factor [Chloroflexota bacterium]|nr:MAG: response regulator transcription factor [Chloroflexota bacterium]
MSSEVRVLLVDDQILFRKALCSVLADWDELQVVGEAANGAEAVAKAAELRPDIVLMDIHMPGMNGLDATRLIRRDVPEARIVMLTVSEQDDHLFEAIRIGAQGYLLKNVTAEVLREMLTAVARGETPISPLMAGKILNELVQHVPFMNLPRPEEELTPREKEVLVLAAEGLDNGMIAERLCLAPGTVKRHMHNILAKLHARSRAEAAACALHYGLISTIPET